MESTLLNRVHKIVKWSELYARSFWMVQSEGIACWIAWPFVNVRSRTDVVLVLE